MSTLWKWQEVVCGLLMATVGVVLLMIPELTTLLIAQAAAGVLGAAGLVFIIVYFVRRRSSVVGYDLVKAAVLIAAGILVYLHAKEVSSVIFMAFGILILICGILIVQRSIDLRHSESVCGSQQMAALADCRRIDFYRRFSDHFRFYSRASCFQIPGRKRKSCTRAYSAAAQACTGICISAAGAGV